MDLKTIQEIIELDKINMQPILEKFSIEFNPQLRKDGLENEINKGAKFVIVKRNNNLIAYLEYIHNIKMVLLYIVFWLVFMMN